MKKILLSALVILGGNWGWAQNLVKEGIETTVITREIIQRASEFAPQLSRTVAQSIPAATHTHPPLENIPGVTVTEVPDGRIYSFQTFPEYFELPVDLQAIKQEFPEYEAVPSGTSSKRYPIQVNSRRGHPHFLSVEMNQLVLRLAVFNLQQTSLAAWQSKNKPMQYKNLADLVAQLADELHFPVVTKENEKRLLYTIPVYNLQVFWNNQLYELNPRKHVISYQPQTNDAQLLLLDKETLNTLILEGEVPDELQDKSVPNR